MDMNDTATTIQNLGKNQRQVLHALAVLGDITQPTGVYKPEWTEAQAVTGFASPAASVVRSPKLHCWSPFTAAPTNKILRRLIELGLVEYTGSGDTFTLTAHRDVQVYFTGGYKI